MHDFIQYLKQNLSQEILPNTTFIERDLMSKSPKPPVVCAVMITFFEKENDIYLPLIQRPIYEGIHSGQIAFPGGKKDNTDHSLIHTAVRECIEEVGIDIPFHHILGFLPDIYIPPSNFLVTPVVSFLEQVPTYNTNQREVANILEIKALDILKPEHKTMQNIKISTGQTLRLPCYQIDNQTIWGATARMLDELSKVIQSFAFKTF